MAEKSRNGKVTVVGAGFYGSTTALRLAEYDIFETVVLTDIVEGKPEGIALDVLDVAGHVAPNPGGVGPMTRAMLLVNVVAAAEQQAGSTPPDRALSV